MASLNVVLSPHWPAFKPPKLFTRTNDHSHGCPPVRDPFDREGWLFELKWDGFRAIADTDGAGGVKLYSRRHNDFKKRFPPITDALANLKNVVILDGEIVALDE